MRSLLTVLACLLAASRSGSAQKLSEPTDAQIRTVLAERIDTVRSNVGIVVGLVGPDGRRIMTHGRADVATGARLTGDTVFEIGSVTKVLTSLMLAAMVDRGDVRLADPVNRFLPAGSQMPSAAGRSITLEDLATHTSGLPFWPTNVPTGDVMTALAAYTDHDLLRFLSSFEVPDDAKRKWSYSNVDAGLLGYLLSRHAGGSYEAVLRQFVTGPLGLSNTVLTLDQARATRRATGYTNTLKPAPAWNVPALAGGGSLHSTVSDLMTLLESLGNGNTVAGRALPLMLATRRAAPGFAQALGWMALTTGPDDEIIFHDGQTLGFASAVAYDPRSRRGVVVLSNTAASVGDIARHLLRPSLPLTKTTPVPVRAEIALDSTLLDRYAGSYSPGSGVRFVVTHEGDALMLQLPGLPKFRIRPESARSFFVAENHRLTISFDLDERGDATRLRLNAATGDVTAARTP